MDTGHSELSLSESKVSHTGTHWGYFFKIFFGFFFFLHIVKKVVNKVTNLFLLYISTRNGAATVPELHIKGRHNLHMVVRLRKLSGLLSTINTEVERRWGSSLEMSRAARPSNSRVVIPGLLLLSVCGIRFPPCFLATVLFRVEYRNRRHFRQKK